jgi:hypothetical protein
MISEKNKKQHKLIRFDFPPGTPPEAIAQKIQELCKKEMAKKK